MSKVLAIPDLHTPFEHKDSLEFLSAVYVEYGIDQVVFMGDVTDMHSFSQYGSDPEGYSPGHEIDKAIEALQPFYHLFPKAKVCTGNHEARIAKKIFSAGLPRNFVKELHEILECPKGWEWADEWVIDDVIYFHGTGFSGMYAPRQAMMSKMSSVVIGHLHSNAMVIHTAATHDRQYSAMNTGCLVDHEAYAMNYAKHARTKVSLGCGVVLDGIMHFIPMRLDKHNRWVGKL